MIFDDLAFLVGLLLIPSCYFFFPKLLISNRYTKEWIAIILALFTFGMIRTLPWGTGKPHFAVMLCWPAVAYAIFKCLLFLFRKWKRRDPKSAPRPTILTLDDGHWSDRHFEMAFLFSCVLTPIFIITFYKI